MSEDTKRRELEAGTTPAGRVVRDKRGHTTWQWTDEERANSTSVLLKFLDNEALGLEPTQSVPALTETAARSEPDAGAGRDVDEARFELAATWRAPAPAGLGGRRSRRSGAGEDESDDSPGLTRDTAGGFDPYDHS